MNVINRSRRVGRQKRSVLAQMNVVPYIDVMLVLLVIFMVTAPLLPTALVELPSVGQKANQTKTPPIVVTIRANGEISARYQGLQQQWVEHKMNSADLQKFLLQRQKVDVNQPVVIAADKRVRYDAVMKVMAQLKKDGVKRIGLLVRPQ